MRIQQRRGVSIIGALTEAFKYVCDNRSKEKLKLNVWNTVNLERAHRKGEITINGKNPVRGEAPVRPS